MYLKVVLGNILFLFSFVHCEEKQSCTSNEEVIRKILTSISPDVIPPSVTARVQYILLRINCIDIISGQAEFTFTISNIWNDHSIAFNHLKPCSANITGGNEVLSNIWTPKLDFLDNINKNRIQNEFVVLYANGTVWRSFRIDITARCSTDLKKFPMSEPICQLTYSSELYNAHDVHLKWYHTPFVTAQFATELPSYMLVDTQYDTITYEYPFGLWTELVLKLKLRNRYGFFIKSIYVPSITLVVVSGLSFCLGQRITARAVLGVGSLVMLLLQYLYATKDLPQISYITYLDIWMVACLAFVFYTLLELALFTLMSNSTCTNNSHKYVINQQSENETTTPLISISRRPTKRQISNILDIVSAVLFWLGLTIFIAVYFLVIFV